MRWLVCKEGGKRGERGGKEGGGGGGGLRDEGSAS